MRAVLSASVPSFCWKTTLSVCELKCSSACLRSRSQKNAASLKRGRDDPFITLSDCVRGRTGDIGYGDKIGSQFSGA